MSSHDSRQNARFVLDSIRQIVRALRVASRAHEKEHDLTSAQLFVLQKLRDTAGISLNELSERTFTHQSSVSTVVSRLVERGLVSRKPARDDRRRLELSLTPAGARVVKSAPESAQEALLYALLKQPSAELAILASSLSKACADAGFGAGKAPMFFEEI